MKSTTSWHITPSRPLKVNGRFEGTCHLPLQGPPVNHARRESLYWAFAFSLVTCSAHSSTLNVEATSSSETSVDFQRTARRYNSENINVYVI
jgi:hypothetical protein